MRIRGESAVHDFRAQEIVSLTRENLASGNAGDNMMKPGLSIFEAV